MADLLSLSSSCPCCSQPVVLVLSLLIPCFIFYTVEYLFRATAPTSSIGKISLKVLTFLSRGSSVLVGVLAVLLGLASKNQDLKNQIFYHLFKSLSKDPEPMDAYRCTEEMKHLSGRVLEIGPGLGANFRCWRASSGHNITEWVGVEPNPFFHQPLLEAMEKYKINFPVQIVGLKGEVVDVDAESFDYVVGTHVLCSVDDVHTVLSQVRRALKPSGVYYFLEHVRAAPNTLLHFAQYLMEPYLTIVGNNCHFRTLWQDLAPDTGLPGFQVNLEHFDAPMGLPVLTAHIKGYALKLQ